MNEVFSLVGVQAFKIKAISYSSFCGLNSNENKQERKADELSAVTEDPKNVLEP